MLLSTQFHYWILTYTICLIFKKNLMWSSSYHFFFSKIHSNWVCAPKNTLLYCLCVLLTSPVSFRTLVSLVWKSTLIQSALWKHKVILAHGSRGGIYHGGMGASRELSDPIFNYNHEAKRVNWKWGKVGNLRIPSSDVLLQNTITF